MANKLKHKVIIASDFHHGSQNFVNYINRLAKDNAITEKSSDKIKVYSTGDFAVYNANANAPSQIISEYANLFQKASKPGITKEEKEAINKKIKEEEPKVYKAQIPIQSEISADMLQRVAKYIEGGKIKSATGNSDVGVGSAMKKYAGRDVFDTFKETVDFARAPKVEKQGETSFVILPHDAEMVAKYKDKKYAEIKEALKQDSNYQANIKGIKANLQSQKSKYVNVLMHESPKPENPAFGYSADVAKSRLPDALRAYYDAVVGEIAGSSKGKNIKVFHGHLHKPTSRYAYKTNTANYSNVQVYNLNIGDVVEFDTKTGSAKIKSTASYNQGVAEASELSNYKKHESLDDFLKAKKGGLEAKAEGPKSAKGVENKVAEPDKDYKEPPKKDYKPKGDYKK